MLPSQFAQLALVIDRRSKNLSKSACKIPQPLLCRMALRLSGLRAVRFGSPEKAQCAASGKTYRSRINREREPGEGATSEPRTDR